MGELKISSFGTIYGTNFDEMFIDDFLKEMESNIDKNDYNVSYDRDKFLIIYNGVDYVLTLDKVVMDNYAFGKYNSLTLRLKKLVDKEQKINQSEATKRKELINRERIIRDAEENNLIPNNEAKEIYVEYLKKSKRFSLSKIKNYFSNLGEDIIDSKDTVNDVIWYNIWPFINMYEKKELTFKCLLVGVCQGIVATFPTAFFLGNFLGICFLVIGISFIIPFTVFLVPFFTFLGVQIKNRFKRLKKYIKGRKILNHKIKQLTEELKNGCLQSISMEEFDKTIEEPIVKREVDNFKDQIMKEISDIVDRLSYINSNDRSILLKELQDILNEYIKRSNNIENQSDSKQLQLDRDNVLKLKMDMMSRISLVESKMLDIRNKDISINERTKEQLLLEEKIDDCYINMDDINAEVARREENKERVLRQQRTSKENKRHI